MKKLPEHVVVITEVKLDVLRRLHGGEMFGVGCSWVVRTLVMEGLVQEMGMNMGPITGISVRGLAMLTANGLLAVERGRVGAMKLY